MKPKIPSPQLLKTLCKCSDCHLYETADNPYIGGRFVDENYQEAPLCVLVGEAPGRVENQNGACFQHTSLKNLEKALGENLNKCYLTNICRCVPWADITRRDKVRKPTLAEMDCCLPWLKLEISKFPEGTPVVAMGATAFQALMPSLASSRITEIAGREFDLVIHDRHYKLFAQVHPASISYNPALSETFYGTFNKILKSLNQKVVDSESEFWEMLDPSKAIQMMNETKQLYLDKVIKYVVTDTETSGFIPWHDRVIMFGLAHTADKKGYSIPLEIQNRFDFPDFPVDLYPIDMEITDHDIQLIKQASRDLFNTVPIVGHNLKFDLKMMAYHDFLDIQKIKVYDDTLLMSAILIGRGWNGESLGLKEMCVKLLGISEGWDWVVDQWIGKYKRVADRTYDNIPTCILGKYCALDHYYTRELHEKLFPMIAKHDCKLLIKTFNVATKAYSEAELKGIEIDWDIYEVIKHDSDKNLERIIKEIKKDPHIKQMMMEKYNKDLEENSKKKRPKDEGVFKQKLQDGDYFSLGSVKDKRELIYKRYKVKVFSTTDKGEASCDRSTLKAIAENTDNDRLKKLCENFLEYNKFSKLKSTYIDNLPDQCDQNKIYHADFNIAGTVTGRLCVHGDTVVKSPWGDIKIKDIPLNSLTYVYSYNLEKDCVETSKAMSLGMTRREYNAVKVTLENDKEVITTLDHKFLMKDKNYVEAKDLKKGDLILAMTDYSKDILDDLFEEAIDGEWTSKVSLSSIKNNNAVDYISIKNIEFIQYDNLTDFYDLTVSDNHNFVIDGNIIIHNSSSFHTLPRKSSIKYLYTSREHKDSGSIWLSPDMSQLELRVTAGIANESSWINAYLNNEDLHQRTAANMFNKSYSEVTKDERKIGKGENFSLLYGSSAKSQAEKLGVSVEEAEEMLMKYKKTIPNIVKLISKQEEFATQHGYIWNMFNRYMPVPDAQSTDKKIKAHGLRESFNYLIQSTGSDIVTTSFARLYLDLKQRKMNTLLYGTVHDSIETSVADYELITMVNLFKFHFEHENNMMLKWMNGCPLKISFEFGTSWGSSVEFEADNVTDNSIVLKTSGLECNIYKLYHQLEKCYDVSLKELERKELTEADFSSEDSVKDRYKLEIEMTISNKEGHKVIKEI